MQPILREGEVVKRTNVDNIAAEWMLDFRVAVLSKDIHVIAIINDNEGAFRVYDNDPQERSRGTYKLQRADEIMDERPGGVMIGVLEEGSDLSHG